jgi:hypothetical protein
MGRKWTVYFGERNKGLWKLPLSASLTSPSERETENALLSEEGGTKCREEL